MGRSASRALWERAPALRSDSRRFLMMLLLLSRLPFAPADQAEEEPYVPWHVCCQGCMIVGVWDLAGLRPILATAPWPLQALGVKPFGEQVVDLCHLPYRLASRLRRKRGVDGALSRYPHPKRRTLSYRTLHGHSPTQ